MVGPWDESAPSRRRPAQLSMPSLARERRTSAELAASGPLAASALPKASGPLVAAALPQPWASAERYVFGFVWKERAQAAAMIAHAC